MESSTLTILLISGIVFLFAIYLIFFNFLGRKIAWKTVTIPYSQIRKMRKRKYRDKNREYAFVYDFNHERARAERIRIRQGFKGSVVPRANWDDEIVFHTHQKVKDPIENILRERPSGSDIVQLVKSPRRQDGIITPTGKIVLYEETPMIDIRKVENLDKKEVEIQQRVFLKKGFSRQTAKEVNKAFMKEIKKSGVKVRRINPNKSLRLKTEVRE